LIKNYDDKKVFFQGTPTRDAMYEFIRKNSKRWVEELNEDTAALLLKPTGNKGVILFRSNVTSNTTKLDAEFRELAKNEKADDFFFMITDIKEGIGQKLGKVLNITEMPKMVIIKTEKKIEKFTYEGNLVAVEMKKFVRDIREKDIIQNSEEEPLENEGPFYKLVARSFNSKVVNADTNIFVLFCTEDTKDCTDAHSVMQKLAEKLKDNPGIRIGYIDINKNKIAGHPITTLPTIKLFLKDDKNAALIYRGEVEVQRLEGFLITFCLYKYRVKHSDL
jgi:hypothetical protein